MRTAKAAHARTDFDLNEAPQPESHRRLKATVSAGQESELALAMTDALEHILDYERRCK
jgi:hypothetical protein